VLGAPSVSDHLSGALVGRLGVSNVDVVTLTLHVGLGTFQPVLVDDLDQHKMHREWFEISRPTADAIKDARAAGKKIVAVGTTVVRALESAANDDGTVRATAGDTALLIQPGYRFRIVDMLFTNFHLPKSTLLALVCAFGGTDRVLSAYEQAVRDGYRFYSYGDAMLLEREA
jgi:S-adenosylmethionine:tRNA ribosyltransferase-isomerase